MSIKVSIRSYRDDDFESVLNLLRLNTPAFFSPTEEPDLIDYLKHKLEYYYVLEIEESVRGSGGFNLKTGQKTAMISWDILHPDFQGKSLGSRLLQFRIEEIKTMKTIDTISVRTSQLVYPFYEKNGFQLVNTQADYWAKGFDLYEMVYR